MNSEEKEISYKSTNSYSTLNVLTAKTKYVWFVCHGLGYLSRYFLKYFKELNPEEHYIIAPQAQSKYYLSSNFKHVGASWLTKENTEKETENILRFFDAILEKETNYKDKKMIVLGYSQGVSVALRYIAKRQLQCDHLVIHSGSIPKELKPIDFEFFKGNTSLLYGNKDAYLTEERIKSETERAKSLFGNSVNIVEFEGVHEVNKSFINKLL
ncbi:alpha/beta hydrolase [Sediminibacter sp. Hel_I_10]|uniref:alpha/beta hydrolase n=1 Tax=Sediminibacter sp. Hel_I_10 TaxID=1392490 RepID=UPI00047B4EB3|nr:esterase [Sediminibacter sp. Hel_I_10]